MKIVQLNSTCGRGSTGKICRSISEELTDKGIENYVFYTLGNSDYPLGKKYSSKVYVKIQALKSRILGNGGFNSSLATRKLIRELNAIHPDIIHIHNIHSHDCNLSMLFEHIRKSNIKVIWTFHDCWAFTANCPHFTMARCDKWKDGCSLCPQIRDTSWFFDRSHVLFNRKMHLFTSLPNMTIVTPSEWLAGLVKQSFLQEYPVKVINNGIDLSIFKPTDSDFREKHGLEGKYVLLGVAFGWGERKGLDVFIELSRRLDDRFKIVLVGTDKNVDKLLPGNIISIHRTQNQAELAEIYSAADLFVNPTREDNYPTVNMESLACGTPVVTFQTGGSAEIIDKTCGAVVECDDIDALESEIVSICESSRYSKEACLTRAKMFDNNERYKEYLELYQNI